MSTSTAGLPLGPDVETSDRTATFNVRAYFFSDSRRVAQTILGLIWLLDAGLQFQSFMYSQGFVQSLTSMTPGQPQWLASSITWAAHIASHHLVIYNTLFALTQAAVGLGLLFRPTVKAALLVSFVWVLVVWWFGEAFGMLFMNMASPLTGAPGAVVLYALIGLLVWPSPEPGGLLGARGARLAWGALWLVMAWLWLETPSSGANAVTSSINAAPSGMSWLSTVQDWAASAARGDGVAIALLMAALSAAIGISVAAGWRPRTFLILGVALNLAFWVLGQGLGGLFEGNATDPQAAPLFVLLAYVVYSLIPFESAPVRRVSAPASSAVTS